MERELLARARRWAALGDPLRLAIVDALVSSDRSPQELLARFPVPSNLLAHHLGVLEEAGLIERTVSEGDHRRRYIHLTEPGFGLVGSAHPISALDVVFVCTRNSARSQLAAALWNTSHEVRATSAGTHPAERVHPRAVVAGERFGVDLAEARPRSLDDLAVEPGLMVAVCDRAHEELTSLPWSRLHWSVPDPVGSGRARAFDATIRRLQRRIDRVGPMVQRPARDRNSTSRAKESTRARSG